MNPEDMLFVLAVKALLFNKMNVKSNLQN